jgi:phosphocarrier protein
MKEGSAINGAAMMQASVLLAHDVGLHARPSVKLTKLAKTFAAEVELATAREGPWIDAKSIVKVMALKARRTRPCTFAPRGPMPRRP